jgi:hypothetical protein
MVRARWVMVRARWVMVRARWVMVRARWVMVRARWVMVRLPGVRGRGRRGLAPQHGAVLRTHERAAVVGVGALRGGATAKPAAVGVLEVRQRVVRVLQRPHAATNNSERVRTSMNLRWIGTAINCGLTPYSRTETTPKLAAQLATWP